MKINSTNLCCVSCSTPHVDLNSATLRTELRFHCADMTSSVDTLLKIKEYANGMFPDAEGNNDDGDYRIKLINIEDNGLTTLTLTFGVYTKDGDPVIQSKIFARQSVVGNLANILGEIWQRNTKCVITTIGSNGRRPMEFIINQK